MRLGLTRPSYWRVRELLFDERATLSDRAAVRDAVLTQLALGRVPRLEDLAP